MRKPTQRTPIKTMTGFLAIGSDTDTASVLGTRYSAINFRERMEQQLESCPLVEINFAGAYVTQAFVDELLGPLILRMGSIALERLTFSGCGEEAKAILKLVIAGRLRDHFARREMRAGPSVDSAHCRLPGTR